MGNSTVLLFHIISSIELPIYVSADSTYETPGRLYAQMAEFDRLTNQIIYKDILKRYFVEAESLNPGFLDMMSVRSR